MFGYILFNENVAVVINNLISPSVCSRIPCKIFTGKFNNLWLVRLYVGR